MIQDIINEIKEAEKRAAQIIQNSRQEAKQLILSAEISAENIKRNRATD